MFCNRCGALVEEGQRFCAECGHSLTGITDPTEPLEAVAVAAAAEPLPPPILYDFADDEPDDLTAVMFATGTPPMAAATTDELPVVVADEPTTRLVAPPVLLPAVILALLTVVAALFTILEISTDLAEPSFQVGSWRASTFASNLPIAAFVAAGTLAIGLLAAVLRQRWGTGLVGGAALALSGWAMLVLAVAEESITLARAAATVPPTTEAFTITIERGVGYWLLAVVAGLGLVTFVVSLLQGGDDGRDGLNPWIAAAGAATAMVAAVGPLIPQGVAGWDDNWTTGPGITSLFLAGRLWQMAMLAYGGVLGFLLVRRYGLGLAIGSTVVVVVMTFTSLLELGTRPMGPAVANPGAPVDPVDLHAVTIVGAAALIGLAAIAVLASFETAARERFGD